MKFLEETFVPMAAKVGSQKHLASIRDAFTSIMPLTIAGAIGVLLLCIGGLFDTTGLNMPGVMNGYNNFIASTKLNGVFSALNNGTLNFMAILLASGLSRNLVKANGGDEVAGAAIGMAGYVCGMGGIGDATAGLFGSQGLFVAMIMSIVIGEIFPRLSNNPKLKITMPDGVPPAVAKAFSSLIPAILTMIIVACIYTYLEALTGMNVWALVNKYLSAPLAGLSQSVGMVIVMYFMIDFLWIFGLHGANIVGSVTTPILTPLALENTALFAAGQEPKNTVVGGLTSGFVFFGGSGATIGCLVAIFLFSKSKAARTIATLATAPGLFEINEPLTFGLPIVLNMVLAIPFVLGPIVLGVLTYFIMEAGLIRRPCIDAPWVTPPIICGFLCTGGDFKAVIWNVIEIVGLSALWTPFVLMNDRVSGE